MIKAINKKSGRNMIKHEDEIIISKKRVRSQTAYNDIRIFLLMPADAFRIPARLDCVAIPACLE
jgi:hypothetical protein